MSTNTLLKLKATADILGGNVFFASEQGTDPEYPGNNELQPNGLYIRLEGSDGSMAYISAYELNESIKQIDEMTKIKANQSDLDALSQALENKVSTAEFELIEADIEAKASKTELENVISTLNAKADSAALESLIETVNSKANSEEVSTLTALLENKASQTAVDELVTAVSNKANSSEITSILSDIKALQDAVALITDASSITALTNQINYLNTELAKKLTIDDLTSINTNITNLNNSNTEFDDRLSNVEVNLNKKANTAFVQTQLSDMNTTLTNVVKKVETKADKSDIANKANKSDMDSIIKKVNTLVTTVNALDTEVDSNYNTLTASVNKKADKKNVDDSLREYNNVLTQKADKTTVNDTINRINARLASIENNYDNISNSVAGDIEELECELNNLISELKTTVNSQSKILNQQDTKITKLQESTGSYSEALKQTWVRVLSSKEYKNLRPAPEGASYNNRYRYPNTVYMVVDFNKPKAIYIGDIQIAQAEQKGSVGFAYTFPIVF